MKQRTIEPAAIHKRFIRQRIKSINLGRNFAAMEIGEKQVHIDLASATLSSVSNWLVLRKITLTAPQGSFSLAGLSKDAVAEIETAIQEAKRRGKAFAALSEQADQVRASLSSWDTLAARDAYLAVSEARRWQTTVPKLLVPVNKDADLFDRLAPQHRQKLMRMIPLMHDAPRAAARRNADYVLRQLCEFKEFFDTVESSPLTDQQRQAIVHDEDNALVIAGAGTGKTSCAVGKVGYILKKGWAKPEEILLLAFTAKAADEMRERIRRRLGADVTVRTFHGLGLEIITQSRGKKPSLCPEATDPKLKAQTLAGLITDLAADKNFREDLLAFQSSLRRAYKPAWEFKSQAEYTQYLLDVEPRALNGQLLRSYEECEIANWLVSHGVSFEYERPYEVDTATIDHRQYKPDFFLPEHSIYIEHWGVNREEKSAPFMDPIRYRQKMDWARARHAEQGTTLVETYSWEKQEGILLSSLEAKLLELGVKISPISVETALDVLNAKGRVDSFSSLVGTFLSLFKSGGYSVEELRPRAQCSGDTARSERFLRLFARIVSAYESLLHSRDEIDFDDMITQAHTHCKDGSYRSAFRYIIVDEFQDISVGRAKLIQALRDQVEGAKLFCVGDDWQSIYRFTGSDISRTTEFEKHFGPTRKTALDRTFRFHDKIAAFSSRFVQKNPSQLRKQLSTIAHSDRPGVVVHTGEGSGTLSAILAEIAAEDEASVFLLSRYGFTSPPHAELQALQRRFPLLSVRAMTAHTAKGAEADYVIVLGLSSGKHGFPSEIADDPVLEIVLADGEAYEFSEERRLFYVALTRARKRVYLVADAASPSSFVREVLADNGYEKLVFSPSTSASDVCPACERGKITKREGGFGVFYSCSNQPICDYKAALCSRCGRGRMRDSDGGEALCDVCGFRGRVCPLCHIGVLFVKKNSRNGSEFWGCSNYGRASEPCGYTEPINGRRAVGPNRQSFR